MKVRSENLLPQTIAALAAALCFAAPASAQILLRYDFDGTSLAASSVNPNLSGSDVNFTGSTAAQVGFADLFVVNSGDGANSPSTAVANSSYFQFTITPASGYKMTLASFDLDAAYGSPGSGFDLRSSVDNFATTLAAGNIGTGYPNFTTYNIALTDPAYLDIADDLTFRIYNYAGGSNPSGGYDNITVNGSTAVVPEPASVATIAALGLVAFALNRRRSMQPARR